MSKKPSLDARVSALEEIVSQLIAQNGKRARRKDWRNSVGMFPNNEGLKQIDEEGRKIRDAERRKARQ